MSRPGVDEATKAAAEQHAELIASLGLEELRALERALHREYWRRWSENAEHNAAKEAERDRAVLRLHGLECVEASRCTYTKGSGWNSVVGHRGSGSTKHLVRRSGYELLLLCSGRPAERITTNFGYRICARCQARVRNWPLGVARDYLEART